MVKTQRYYEDNEKETYGLIPNLGEFVALIQIYYGFEYDPSFPIELLNKVCLEEFGELPKHLSPTPFDEDLENKIRINISLNHDRIIRYGIKERGKSDISGSLPALAWLSWYKS